MEQVEVSLQHIEQGNCEQVHHNERRVESNSRLKGV
jgi:hypothetical protein